MRWVKGRVGSGGECVGSGGSSWWVGWHRRCMYRINKLTRGTCWIRSAHNSELQAFLKMHVLAGFRFLGNVELHLIPKANKFTGRTRGCFCVVFVSGFFQVFANVRISFCLSVFVSARLLLRSPDWRPSQVLVLDKDRKKCEQ